MLGDYATAMTEKGSPKNHLQRLRKHIECKSACA